MTHPSAIRLLIVLLSALLCACDGVGADVEILTYDQATDSYTFQIVTVETLTDIDRLEGRATALIGGTSMRLDYTEGMVKWDRVGRPVSFGAMKSDGVYYPEDFASLAMISTYYNIERAMRFFAILGLPEGDLGRLDTYYLADVVEIYADPFTGQVDEIRGRDNAFYLAVDERTRGFYILPLETIEHLPLAMNIGVIVHEYAHAVFQHLVYDRMADGGAGLNSTAYNYIYSLNEGVADIMAVMHTGDPDFMTHSLDDSWAARDASALILYRPSYDTNAMTYVDLSFDPYEIGAFISAAVYEATRRMDGLSPLEAGIPGETLRTDVAASVLDALRATGGEDLSDFTPALFFDRLISRLDPDRAAHLCSVLRARYAIHYGDLAGCL